MYGNKEVIVVTLFVIAKLCYLTTADSIQPNAVEPPVADQPVASTYIAKRGQFKYQVSIRSDGYYHQCAGALLSDRWTITSGTCLYYSGYYKYNLRLVFGGYDLPEGYSYFCDYIKIHEHMSSENFENDAALLKTDRPIIFNEFIQPIPYFKGNTEDTKFCSGISDNIVAIGWGHDKQSTLQYLQYTNLKVFSVSGCSAIWNEVYWPTLTAGTMGCAHFNGSYSAESSFCNSEMALPLATDGVLVGITAGYPGNNCDSAGMTILFTHTSSLAEWIFRITNIDGVNTL